MNLTELVRSYLTPDVIDKAAAFAGEGSSATRRGLETAVAAVVAGVTSAGSSIEGAQRVAGAIEEAGLLGPMAGVTQRLTGGSLEEVASLGSRIVSHLVGARASSLTNAAANVAGITSSTMASLMGVAAALVFGVLGSQMHARRLDTPGLAAFLADQRHSALSALPAPLAVALVGTPRARADEERRMAAARTAPRSIARFWPVFLAIPAALIVGALLARRAAAPQSLAPGMPLGPPAGATHEPEGVAERQPTGAPVAPEAPPAAMLAPASALPGGPIGHDLAQYLGSPGGAPSQRFTFQHLNFELAKADLSPDADETLDDLAAVLKAHPDADVTVEGHCDATGDAADNRRLSLARADTVKSALVARGVEARHIKTDGGGAERPLASNATDEGRAKNRRADLVVTKITRP